MSAKSTSEVGHAKNAANFNAAINIFTEMGPLYNPSNSAITLQELKVHNEAINIVMQSLSALIPPFRNIVAERQIAFATFSKRCTRAKKAYYAVQPLQEHRDHLDTLVRKARGLPKKTDNPDETATTAISRSQLSYDNRTATLQDLINFLAADLLYHPNETELTISELTEFYNTLKKHNDDASKITASLITGRNKRNNILYDSTPNAIKLMEMAKNYVRSIDGAEDYYQALVALKFTDKRK